MDVAENPGMLDTLDPAIMPDGAAKWFFVWDCLM